MKPEVPGRAVLRLSYVSATIALAVVAGFAALYEQQAREVFRRAARAQVADRVDLLRSDLENAIDGPVQLVQGLVSVLKYAPDLDQAAFARVGADLIDGRPDIRLIAAAPDLVVSRVYPLRDNDGVLGVDYRTLPAQIGAAQMARDLRQTVVAGPLDLVQGGRGFVARTPVFLDAEGERRFWGLVSTVMDEDALYRAAGLTDPNLSVSVALSGRDGLAVNGEVFFGDPALLAEEPVLGMAVLPYGAWQIAAVPRGGWRPPPGIARMRALFALAGLLIVAPILGTARLVASRQDKLALIRERDAELARVSWRLEFALAASKVGVWDVNLATDQLIWDQRAKALFGFAGTGGPVPGAQWIAALHPEDRERALAEAEAAVAQEGRFNANYRIVRPDGTVRHVRDMAAVYRDRDGSRRLAGLVWDVTADVERAAELELRRREAEAATVAKSQFLATMSHEIRTPMNGVLGMLDLLLAGPLPWQQRERARIAQASARSLLEILNDILDFSKLEAGQVRITAEGVQVRRVVGEVIALLRAGAEQKGLALTCTVSAAVPEWVVTDPVRLRQILVNLVSNAVKFTEAGWVRVSVGYAGEALTVEVEDSGIGIPTEHLGRIFERFVQADSSLARRSGGTGLGLAISKQLIELMGGTLRAQSTPGEGSSFWFSVAARPAAAPVRPSGCAAGAETAPVPPLRVLLAEDNATNQYLVTALLRAGGHTVTVVESGEEAVRAVQADADAFEVLLMDVHMPRMDGPAATRAIRALPGPERGVPIIALTANAMPGDREICLAAGMTDYVTKPVDIAALNAALRRACDTPPRKPYAPPPRVAL